MFQFRRFPAYAYLIQRTLTEYGSAGFPHSDISGSLRICRSPKLFAACHVLRRLLMPRHSPCALFSLTCSGSRFPRIMQTTFFSEVRNRNCYPLLESPQLLSLSSVALLFFLLRCSVFKVPSPVSLETGYKYSIFRALVSVLKGWWAQVGSNHRPYDYQSYALAS